jgi:hypothetical protein
LPDGTAVTVKTTARITHKCLLAEIRPKSTTFHHAVQAVGWLAFNVHAVTLRMTCLAMQGVLVAATVLSSVATIRGWMTVDADNTMTFVGRRLHVSQHGPAGVQTRAERYAQLKISKEEEQ